MGEREGRGVEREGRGAWWMGAGRRRAKGMLGDGGQDGWGPSAHAEAQRTVSSQAMIFLRRNGLGLKVAACGLSPPRALQRCSY